MNLLTKDSIIRTLEQYKQEIRSFGVHRIELFGSYARGEQSENSDIDFLVEFDSERGLFEDYSDLLIFLEDLFGKPVDLVKSHLVRRELQPYIFDGVRHEARL